MSSSENRISLFFTSLILSSSIRMSYSSDSESHTKHSEEEWNPVLHKISVVIVISELELNIVQPITSGTVKGRQKQFGV